MDLINSYNSNFKSYKDITINSFLQCTLSRGMIMNFDFANFIFNNHKKDFTFCMYVSYCQRLIMSNIINEELIIKYKPFCIWYPNLPNFNTLNNLYKFESMHDSLAIVCIIKDYKSLFAKLVLKNYMYVYDFCVLLNKQDFLPYFSQYIIKYPYNLIDIYFPFSGIYEPELKLYFPFIQTDFFDFCFSDYTASNFFDESTLFPGIFGYGYELNEVSFEIEYYNKFNLNYLFNSTEDLILYLIKNNEYFRYKVFDESYIRKALIKFPELKIELNKTIVKYHLNNLYKYEFNDQLYFISSYCGNILVYNDQNKKSNIKNKYVFQFDYDLFIKN